MNRKEMRRIYLCIVYSTLIAILCTIISALATDNPAKNQAFARCPNGTYMNPSGICEQVKVQGLNGNSSNSTVSSLNVTRRPLIRANSHNNASLPFATNTNTSNTKLQPFNTSQLTTSSSLPVNHTLDQQCDWPGHPSCYSVGFKAGRTHPGTGCPIAYSLAFCTGYITGSGGDIRQNAQTDVGTILSLYFHQFPRNNGISKTPTNTITTISGKLELPTSNITSVRGNNATTTGTKAPSAIP